MANSTVEGSVDGKFLDVRSPGLESSSSGESEAAIPAWKLRPSLDSDSVISGSSYGNFKRLIYGKEKAAASAPNGVTSLVGAVKKKKVEESLVSALPRKGPLVGDVRKEVRFAKPVLTKAVPLIGPVQKMELATKKVDSWLNKQCPKNPKKKGWCVLRAAEKYGNGM